jgi:hypothetical protein
MSLKKKKVLTLILFKEAALKCKRYSPAGGGGGSGLINRA